MTPPSARPLPAGHAAASTDVAAVLGAGHPLARAAAALRVVRLDALAVLGAVGAGAAALAAGVPAAAAWLSASLVVELALVIAYAFLTQVVHELARDLVADGRAGLPLAEVAAARERLASPQYRAGLARSLERALDAAERWPDLWIASRPPPGVRTLVPLASDVREIVELLRKGEAPLRAVALVDRLLSGGYDATLYAGDRSTLRAELGRIRFELGTVR